MLTNERIVLSAIDSLQRQNEDGVIEPDKVVNIARTFSFTPEGLTSLADRWQKEGLVEIQWGGKLRVTRAGRDLLEGKQDEKPAGNISINVGGNLEAKNMAIGHGAQAGDEIRISGSVIGDLAAALGELQTGIVQLAPEALAKGEEVVKAVTDVVQEGSKETPDESVLKKYMEKAAELIKSFSSMVEAAEELGPAVGKVVAGLKFIGTACGLVGLF